MTHPGHRLGSQAESAVAVWLAGCGWQVCDRRRRTASGEIDIVAIDPRGTLVAIEVKSRQHGRSGTAAECLDARRVARMRRSLTEYRLRMRSAVSLELRIDLVTVEPGAEPGTWRLQRIPQIDAW